MSFRNSDLLAEFERLTNNLNINLGPEIDKVVEDLSHAFGAAKRSGNDASFGVAQPGVDAVRTADKLELFIDLPGIDPALVDLSVDRREVTVHAHREFDHGEDAELVHAGRRHGTFSRTFSLDHDLDVDNLSARSEHGVLIVSVPVLASAQPRKVTIITDDNERELDE